MFKKLQQNLTLQLVLMSSVVYLVLTTVGLSLLYFDLTRSLDVELRQVLAITRELVLYDGQAPYLSTYKTDSHTVHLKLAVLLWDSNKQPCGSYGVAGPRTLAETPAEISWRGQTWRCLARPITRAGEVIGYLQVETPTTTRDLTTRKSLELLLLMAPFLISGLALCGHAFAGRVIKPVEHTYDLQKRFLADAGHELKTPLSTMLAALDNLHHNFANDESSGERIDKVRRAALRMKKLVFDLILLAKTEQYLEPIETSTVQLDMLLREVMGELEDLFEEKNISLTGNLSTPVQITGNSESLRIIFSNLIKNALQYTNSGGCVTVTLNCSHDSATVEIADTGVGIHPDDLPRVFDRFYRTDNARSSSQGGSGLGLALVKALIARHHGSVSVKSEIAKGSTFTVTLPISLAG